MSKARRRITLQLIPLLDLLLIVLFAQFMQLQDTATKQTARTDQIERAAAESVARVTIERAELERLRAEVEREKQSINAAIRITNDERNQIGAMAAELLKLPPETIRKAMVGKTEEEINRLKKALSALPDPRAADVVHQLATLAELRKACDVWQIHIDDNNVIRVGFGTSVTSFRIDNSAEFDRRLFDWYKSLPPPRSMVIIQVTWGDITFGTKYAVKEGLVKCVERMRNDRTGRSIFEYIILGFRPKG